MIKLLLKINPVLWVFVTAGMMYMDYSDWETNVYNPLLEQIKGEKMALENLKGKLAEIEAFRAQKDEKIAEMDELRKKLVDAKKEFPIRPDLPALLKSLADISEKIGMEFSSFKPAGTQEASEGLRSARIDVKLKGSYVQIMTFLDSVSNLKRIVNSEKVILKPSSKNENTTFRSLDADMELQTYYGGGA